MYVFVGFWEYGTILGNFHICGMMFLLRAVLNILVRNASPKGPMCFRGLILIPSGPCELLFLLSVIAFWTCVVVRVIVCPCNFFTDLSIDRLCVDVACFTMFVNCLVKQFAISLGVFAVLLLNVMVLLSEGAGALLERP